jgi:exosome complex exonuclease RRP6
MPGTTSSKAMDEFKELQAKIQAALVTTTRAVTRLAGEDLSFQRAVHPTVANDLDAKTERLLKISNQLLKSAANGRGFPQLEDIDDVEISWKPVVDVIDSLLEKADTCLDEYTGLIKRKDAPSAESVCFDSKYCVILYRVLTHAGPHG